MKLEIERLREENARLAREAYTWSKAAETYAADAERIRSLIADDASAMTYQTLYTRAQLLAAIEAERHACSIAVWMTLQDALQPDADDKGLEGWMREAEQRVKNRLAGA